jgi:hypothetical protein
MRFVDDNGWVYQAKTKEGLVVELMESATFWVNADTVADFMHGCATRIVNSMDVDIQYYDAESFVDELIRCDYIREIN